MRLADIGNQRMATAVMEVCQRHSLLGVVSGASGSGKTAAARRFADAHGTATYVRMDARTTAASALPQVHQAFAGLGARWLPHRQAAAACQTVLRELLDAQGAALLIVDEAQHLPHDGLEALRGLYDCAGCGMVLLAQDGLARQLSGHQMPQLDGRIGPRYRLPAPTDADVGAVLAASGVQDGGAVEVARAAAELPGGLHNVRALLAMALAAKRAEELDGAALRRFAALMVEAQP